MTEFEALVGLNLIPEIGIKRLRKLLEIFETPEKILKISYEKLVEIQGFGPVIAQKIVGLQYNNISEEISKAEKLGLKIITYQDNSYPDLLKNIYDPPILLYVKGDFKNYNPELAIGIVGTRNPSFYGIENTEYFSQNLAKLGFCIISGMAKGVDAFAHKAALKENAVTIAVMGSGFDNIYPNSNRDLVEKIAQKGAVITEFPLLTKPIPLNFPRRNRIISALSKSIFVIEAGQNSGALITADFALEQSKDVYALPGRIDSVNSFGTNELIKQGAKMVCCLEDIVEDFQMPKNKQTPELFLESLSCEEMSLYNIITKQPIEIDDVIIQTGFDYAKVSSLLTGLELRKIIKKLTGGQVIRS